jgi:spermidine/putrescine transport system permease protein
MRDEPTLARMNPLAWLVLAAGYLFVLAPIFVVVVFSFNEARFAALPWRGFTLDWYQQVFDSRAIMSAVRHSVLVGLAVATTACALGFFGAYGLARWQTRLTGPISLTLLSPLAVPWLFLGLGLLIFLTQIGVSRGLGAVFLGHTVFAAPMSVLIIRARIAALPRAQEEAAWDLGAKPLRAMMHVVLPQARPGIAAAFLLSFTLSFDEFIMAWFLSRFDVTLPVHIWGLIRSGINPTINAIGTLVFTVSITLAVVAQALIRGRRRGQARMRGAV